MSLNKTNGAACQASGANQNYHTDTQPPRAFISDEEPRNPGYPNRPIVYIHPWVTNGLDSSRIQFNYVSGIADRLDLCCSGNNRYSAFYYLTDPETLHVTSYELNVCEEGMDLIACMAACEEWINNGFNHEYLSDGESEESEQAWWEKPRHAALWSTRDGGGLKNV